MSLNHKLCSQSFKQHVKGFLSVLQHEVKEKLASEIVSFMSMSFTKARKTLMQSLFRRYNGQG